VTIRFEPVLQVGLEFRNLTPKEVLAPHFARAVQRALTQSASGPLYGFPLINVRATLVDAEVHPVDSTELAFEAAASMAQRDALEEAGCRLYEPYMRLEVITPEDRIGDVIGYVNTCRGSISEVKSRDQLRVLRAEAPLAQLFGFATKLRSLTQGRGTHTMEPLEYRPATSGAPEFA
jgi:elongation factor G